VIDEMNIKKTNDIGLLVDFYLIGIAASIKGGNPDEELLIQADRIATNDPAILLRNSMMKIYNFEISRPCDIRAKDTIDEIEGIGIEAEEKIHEKFKANRELDIFKENLEDIEDCYNRYLYICRRKDIEPNIERKPIERRRKQGYFKLHEEEIVEALDEERHQEKMFSQLRGVQDVKKKAMIQWMELRIKETEEKKFFIPRIGLRHHAMMGRGLSNLYRSFEEASVYADSLCAGCEEDELFMEVFIEFVTKSFQRHIGEANGKKVEPGNKR
jgi:hypothetical protein